MTAVNLLTYRKELGLSYLDVVDEPIEEVAFALKAWELEAYRDKLNAEGQH